MRWLAVLAAVLSLATASVDARAERRVALVIGNAAYGGKMELANPRHDAEDVGAALKRLGFEVILRVDLDKPGMDAAFGEFADAVVGADAALFYYSGHAMELGGRNYLLPIGATPRTEAEVPYQLARLDDVVAELRHATGVQIVVLDGCRNNPLADDLKVRSGRIRGGPPSRGLARVAESEGLLIAFATQHEQTASDGAGRNSPFTAGFLRHVETPNLEVGALFRRIAKDVFESTSQEQLPEVSISLIGEFFFKEGPPAGPDREVAFWRSIERSTSVRDYEAYLKQFPEGTFAVLARNRIVELTQADQAAASGRTEQPADDAARPVVAHVADPAATAWMKIASRSTDPADFVAFAERFPDSAHAQEARQRAISLRQLAERQTVPHVADSAATAWMEIASRSTDPADFVAFAERFPDSPHAEEARQRATSLRQLAERQTVPHVADPAATAWMEIASRSTDPADFVAFAERFPDSPHAQEARQRASSLRQLAERQSVDCDRLASHPDDRGRPAGVAGVPFATVQAQADKAIAACLTALQRLPDTPRFLYQLGRAYSAAGKSDDALQWFRKAANFGYMPGFAGIGYAYAEGRGVASDLTQSYQAFRVAAEGGYAPAMYELGRQLAAGKGVPANLAQGLAWIEKAAGLDQVDAVAEMGRRYAAGDGVAQDDAEARRRYQHAAELGHAPSMYELARLIKAGKGGTRDGRSAFSWMMRAAEKKWPPAMYEVGRQYLAADGVPADLTLAVRWFRSAADAGNAAAYTQLGILHESGRGVSQDYAEAARLYEKAATGGEPAAMVNLGRLYSSGLGVARDGAKAIRFYVAALEHRSRYLVEQLKTNSGAYDVSVRIAAQRWLIDKGLLRGSADGVIGPDTRAALDRLLASPG